MLYKCIKTIGTVINEVAPIVKKYIFSEGRVMKKRSLAAIMMASAMMLALMGCGSSTSETTTETTPETTAEQTTESSANTEDEDISTENDPLPEVFMTKAEPTFEYNGKTFSFTDDANTVVEGIKSVAKTVDEADNSGDAGNSYDFDKDADGLGLTIATSVNGEKTTIDLMSATGSGFKTEKGITIGSKMEDVRAAYGDPYEIDKFDNGELEIFSCEGFNMSFDIEDGKVVSIVYSNPDFRG